MLKYNLTTSTLPSPHRLQEFIAEYVNGYENYKRKSKGQDVQSKKYQLNPKMRKYYHVKVYEENQGSIYLKNALSILYEVFSYDFRIGGLQGNKEELRKLYIKPPEDD